MKYKLECMEDRDLFITNIDLQKKEKRRMLIFRKFYEDICHEKEKIDKLENGQEWDKIKKIGNPFELIYTSYHKNKKKDSISNYQPISRSYFKMWEIYYNFADKIFSYLSNQDNLVFGHLAEGPGGFMEATYNYRLQRCKSKVPKDTFYGITLRPNNEYVPDWNKMKKIFGDKSNIHIEYGNLYHYQDVKNYIRNFQRQKAFIVTADGGFDYSQDFNGQEINSCQIIYAESVVALNILRRGGTFVCKVFDLFTSSMLKIMYLLFKNFDEVYLYKPDTSRPANSEKYIVCIGYRDILQDDEKEYLLFILQEYQRLQKSNPCTENEMYDIEGIRVPNEFVRMIERYNGLYIEQQKFYLQRTIKLAYEKPSKEEYDRLIKNQVKNAVDWCNKYHISMNRQSMYLTNH
jgi:23S rRNA U2552 (ribose-2'-O)-methylase RlmE/FtsJ